MPSIRIARGVHIDAAHADDLPVRCAAALSVMPPSTVVSGLTAGLLHGLWLPPSAADLPLDVSVVARGRASRAMPRPRHGEFVVHRRQITPDDIAVANGVPVTGLARTWRDLAPVLSLPDLVAAGDSVLRSGINLEALAQQSRSVRGRPGARRANLALPLLDGRSRSRPESHLRVAVAHPDLPALEVNVAVFDDLGQWLGEPDLSLRRAKLALEYQGADHADPEQMRRDMTRVTDLRRAGWEVVLYGPAEVLRRPELIAVDVRAILLRRAPELLRR